MIEAKIVAFAHFRYPISSSMNPKEPLRLENVRKIFAPDQAVVPVAVPEVLVGVAGAGLLGRVVPLAVGRCGGQQRAGMAHVYEEFPGAHSWEYWQEHLADSLRFFGRIMKDRLS